MLRTALGPAIGGWLDDASVGEVMLNPAGSRTPASACPPPMANASSAWSRTMSALKSTPAVRASRPNSPGRGSGLKACCPR